MCSKSQKIINENIEFLKKDLECDILVVCEKLFSTEENSALRRQERRLQKIELFLEFLSKKSFDDLSIFINYLKEWYSWLYDRIDKTINELKEEDLLWRVHTLGGVPSPPQFNVIREKLLGEIINDLKSLKRGDYLVLHGMVGCGKTSLAVEALNCPHVISKFENQVYWLTVGHEGAKDPLFLLTELSMRLPTQVPDLPSNVQFATIELTKRFIRNNWTESLIVLDDVSDESVLDIFDIGAKTLVTTKDRNICKSRSARTKFIKVKEGFTLEETKTLFAKTLNVPESSLPSDLSDTYKYTKGHPFSISLVSQYAEGYQEDLLINKSRWEHINSVLARGNRRWFRRRTLSFMMCGLNPNNKSLRWSMSDLDVCMKSIELSVSTLGLDEKDCFYKLAVFLEDVNIKPEVLGTLWSVDKYCAEQIMMDFVHKSLAVRKINERHNSYVYGVHDLISDFVKKDLSMENEIDLHKDFISKYRALCLGVWSNLPQDDNYIFYYIGYHLKKAGLTEEFAKIYFDLEFLQAKLQITGPADLIRDFKRYQDLIINGDETLIDKVNEYSKFIEDFGVWISQRLVNIVQAALQTNSNTLIHNAGRALALSKPSPEYFIVCTLPNKKVVPESLALKEKISVVCYGRSSDEIIIALDNNTIEVYRLKTKSKSNRFSGHKEKINCLNMSPNRREFLSTSLDKTVRVWALSNTVNTSGERTPSPRERQESYLEMFMTEVVGESPTAVLQHSEPLAFALFSSQGDTIATLCGDGAISVWKEGKLLWEEKGKNFKSIDFLSDDKVLIAADSAQIFLIDSKTGPMYLRTVIHNFKDDFISLRTLPLVDDQGESVIMLCKSSMTLMKAEANSPFTPMDLPIRSPISKFCSIGSYIAITTEDNSLFVLNPHHGAIIVHLQLQKRVVSLCVGESAILTGDEDGKVLMYPLDSLTSPFTRIKWTSTSEPVFASVDNTHTTIKTKQRNSKGMSSCADERCLTVSVGEKVLLKELGDIDRMDVSEDGLGVATSSKTGDVFYYNEEVGEKTLVIAHQRTPSALFLLSALKEHILLLSYPGDQTLIWSSGEKKIKRLWSATFLVEYADLVQFTSKEIIITKDHSNFQMWSLEGMLIKNFELNGPLSINRKEHLLAWSNSTGVQLYQFSEDGTMKDKFLCEDVRHVHIIAFSPSGRKLAITDSEDGLYKVYDEVKMKWTHFPKNDLMKKATSLAVSDNGAICFGGDGLVTIVSSGADTMTTAVLDPAYIVANPHGQDVFAIAEKTGIMYKIKQDTIRDVEEH